MLKILISLLDSILGSVIKLHGLEIKNTSFTARFNADLTTLFINFIV